MNESLTKIRNCFEQFALLAESLRDLGVIRSQRIISDYGEWIACQILPAIIARSKTQKGWDVEADGRRFQVKAHAKALTNLARRTPIPSQPDFDELLIIVLSARYLISAVFRVPREDVLQLRKPSGRGWTLEWNKLGQFRLPEQKLTMIKPLLAASTVA